MRRRPLIAGAAVAAVFLAGFLELAEGLAGSPRLAAFDSQVSQLVQGWRSPPLTAVMVGITNAGDTPAISLAAIAILVALAAVGRLRDAVFTGGVVLVGGLLSSLAKGSFARTRPPVDAALIDLPRSFSFPSGHTMGSMTLAFVMAYLVARSGWSAAWRLCVVAGWVCYAVAVGFSRVYLGVHWPSDVIAAWLLGGALAAAALGVLEVFTKGADPQASA